MTQHTVVAVYETAAQAAAAVRDLQAANILPDAISQHTKTFSAYDTGSSAPPREQGFWAGLFGEPEHDTTVYDRSIERCFGESVIARAVLARSIACGRRASARRNHRALRRGRA